MITAPTNYGVCVPTHMESYTSMTLLTETHKPNKQNHIITYIHQFAVLSHNDLTTQVVNIL